MGGVGDHGGVKMETTVLEQQFLKNSQIEFNVILDIKVSTSSF